MDDVDIRDFSQEELRKTSVWSCRNLSIMELLSPISPCTKKSVMIRFRLQQPLWMQIPLFKNFPKGYDSPVSERGSSFSTGQRQLLAFARTVASQPKILILDEATANIDSETESLVQASLAKMRQGRTTIAIAHRLSTIQDANCIYVLDKGRIIESGTHEELLALGGTYHKMYSLQAGPCPNTL